MRWYIMSRSSPVLLYHQRLSSAATSPVYQLPTAATLPIPLTLLQLSGSLPFNLRSPNLPSIPPPSPTP